MLVISQVYGGGGNSGAVYTHDFIELFNRGQEAVDLSGWSVQYASAAGSSWQVTALAGSVGPGRYYLIRQAPGGGGSQALPAPDASGNIIMSATAGKVALVRQTTPLVGACPPGGVIVDLLGYGSTANCSEGNPRAPMPSNNVTAALRKEGGCADTDDNAADFETGPPSPRNGDTPARPCVEGAAQTFPPASYGGADFLPSADEFFGRDGPAAGVVHLRAAFTSPRPRAGLRRWRKGASASGPRGTRGARPRPRGAWP